MHRRRFLHGLIAGGALLSGCSSRQIQRGIVVTERVATGDVSGIIQENLPSLGSAELDQFAQQQLNALAQKIIAKWRDRRVASAKEYVKYTDNYESRAIVNFETGQITVETIDQRGPKVALQRAIVGTLLTPQDPNTVDLMTDKPVEYTGKPFLSGLVVDHDNVQVQYAWRANRYADYLVANAYQTRKDLKETVHFVSFRMKPNHTQSQQLRYQSYVTREARRFNQQTALINAIIETESAFNPYAVSPASAYGLMQIVPTTAGRDAHRLLYNKDGIPTKETLFQPDKNIEMGAAYLYILDTRYLKAVKHPLSREYCVIAAYNTGSGNVLKAFDANRTTAAARINQMTAQQVYDYLRKNLKYAEARNYLFKVTKAKPKYA